MKSKPVLCAILALGLLSFATSSSAQDTSKTFSLLLSGGYGTTTGGDVPEAFEGMNALIRDIAAATDFAVTGILQSASWGPEFEVELLFRPFRNFGVSFGAGCLRKSEDTKGAAEIASLARISLGWTTAYRLIPLKLSGVYFFPVGPKMTAYAKAGVGYYFGRMTYTVRTEEILLGLTDWDLNEGKATDSGFGFHGGLGLEYPVSPAVSIFLEANGRHVNLKDWKADNAYSDAWRSERQTGTFWYAEEHNEGRGKSYATLRLSKAMPDDSDLRNVRKLAVGFSGFALKAGVKISI